MPPTVSIKVSCVFLIDKFSARKFDDSTISPDVFAPVAAPVLISNIR